MEGMMEFENTLKQVRSLLEELRQSFNVFKAELQKDVPLTKYLLSTICQGEGYLVEQVIKKSRKRELVCCRYMYYSILLDITSMTPRAIGATLGYNRATVFHAKNTVQELLDIKDKSVKNYEKYKQAAIDYRNTLNGEKGNSPKRVVEEV